MTRPTMDRTAASDEGQFPADSAPSPREPGPGLVAAITQGLRYRRPAVRIGDIPGTDAALGVPWLRGVAPVIRNGPVEPLDDVVRPRLAKAIETRDRHILREFSHHDWTEATRLYATALRDVCGLPFGKVAAVCDYNDERRAKREVVAGRVTWCRLAGWPWVAFESEAGRPPDEWHKPIEGWHETLAGQRVDRTFQIWEQGRLGPEPGQSSGAEQKRSADTAA